MLSWAVRAAATLLPLSRASSLGPALREWSYTGRFFDLEARDGICELCGQQDLRYHFAIEHSGTASSLLVGPECIKRFEITGVDTTGQRPEADTRGTLVDRNRRGREEQGRKQEG